MGAGSRESWCAAEKRGMGQDYIGQIATCNLNLKATRTARKKERKSTEADKGQEKKRRWGDGAIQVAERGEGTAVSGLRG